MADLSAAKARQILHDGTVHGKPITDQQRKYFGAVAGGSANKAMEKGQYTRRWKDSNGKWNYEYNSAHAAMRSAVMKLTPGKVYSRVR